MLDVQRILLVLEEDEEEKKVNLLRAVPVLGTRKRMEKAGTATAVEIEVEIEMEIG